MSHVTLRRVAIRLLYDPAFAAALAIDAEEALAGLALSPAERRLLAGVPRAAWRTDTERGNRLLGALADEFPASLAVAPERAASFVSSPHFHRAVQDRGSMAEAFGAHLADDPRASDVARLEAAIAAVRRAPRHTEPSRAGSLRIAPHARVVAVHDGAAALMESLRCGGARPLLGDALGHVLVVCDRVTGDVTVEELPDELATVLTGRAAEPTSRSVLVTRLTELGATPGEAEAAIEVLGTDGILV